MEVSSKPLLIVLGLVASGCGSRPPGSIADSSEDGSSSSGSDESESVGSESGSDTETDTETNTDDTTESETGPGPDLPPPDRECVEYTDLSSFDHLCYGEPESIDPTPTNFIDTVASDSEGYFYAAGLDAHRLLPSLREPAVPLAIDGTTVDAQTIHVDLLTELSIYAIATRSPDALVILDLHEPVGIGWQFPLDAEPTDVVAFSHAGVEYQAIAVADLAGHIHFFDPIAGTVIEAGIRTLEQPLDRLEAPEFWLDEDYGQLLLGLTRATSTAHLLEHPMQADGPIEARPMASEAFEWLVRQLDDTGGAEVLLLSRNPSVAHRYEQHEAEPSWSIALDRDVHTTASGGSVGDYGHFALTTEPAAIGLLGVGNGRGTSFAAPQTWHQAPAGTVDFLYLHDGRFLCASTISGLELLTPEP